MRVLVLLLLIAVSFAGCNEKAESIEWAPRGVAPEEPDKPKANFALLESQLYVGGLVQFEDRSKAGDADIVHWYWDFGDEKSSVERHGEHNYVSPGVYTVVLTVTDSNALHASKTMDISIAPKPVEEEAPPKVIPLNVSIEHETRYGTTYFEGIIAGQNESRLEFFWEFGDGLSARVQNPTHTYRYAGDYEVLLEVRSSDGRSSDAQTLVMIKD